MTVQPLEDTITDLECEQKCYQGDCSAVADWYAWISHGCDRPAGIRCETVSASLCEKCMRVIESDVIRFLRENIECSCGFHWIGQLCDHFRAIKL
jgi:hypothetical protein